MIRILFTQGSNTDVMGILSEIEGNNQRTSRKSCTNHIRILYESFTNPLRKLWEEYREVDEILYISDTAPI